MHSEVSPLRRHDALDFSAVEQPHGFRTVLHALGPDLKIAVFRYPVGLLAPRVQVHFQDFIVGEQA